MFLLVRSSFNAAGPQPPPKFDRVGIRNPLPNYGLQQREIPESQVSTGQYFKLTY